VSTERARLRLGDVLVSLDGDLVTVVAPQWEPGIFFKHVERLDVEVGEPDRHGTRVVVLGTSGGPVPWEVLRLSVPVDRYAEWCGLLRSVESARIASTSGAEQPG
jgi:hypothetical protein